LPVYDCVRTHTHSQDSTRTYSCRSSLTGGLPLLVLPLSSPSPMPSIPPAGDQGSGPGTVGRAEGRTGAAHHIPICLAIGTASQRRTWFIPRLPPQDRAALTCCADTEPAVPLRRDATCSSALCFTKTSRVTYGTRLTLKSAGSSPVRGSGRGCQVCIAAATRGPKVLTAVKGMPHALKRKFITSW